MRSLVKQTRGLSRFPNLEADRCGAPDYLSGSIVCCWLFIRAAFIDEYGSEMQRQFGDEYRERSESGLGGRLRVWRYAATDLASSLPRQHAAELLHNLRFAFRTLSNNAGFTITAVTTLAVAIASVSTVFAFVNAILIHPYPYYRDVGRLVTLWNANPQKGIVHERASYPEYQDWMAGNTVFERSACFAESLMPINDPDGRDEPEMIYSYVVNAGFFSLLGTTAALGRTFSPDEEANPGAKVAVIRHSLWTRRFHSDPRIIGRRISLLGVPYTIIGVMPPDFRLLNRAAEVILPRLDDPIYKVRFVRQFAVLARLRPGVTIKQAQQRMLAIGANVAAAHSESAGWTIRVVPLLADTIGKVRGLLLVLLAAVIFVLSIAAANCANLMLARAMSRSREISIRLALGAGRSRMVRQFIIEGVLLASLGCALALPAVYGMTNLSLRLIPDRTSFGRFLPPLDGVRIDGQVIGCALLISTLTGIVLGLIPALHMSRIRVNEQLKEGGRGDLGTAGTRSRDGVVVGEVALAFVLVIGAGLLIRSFKNLTHIDPGFHSGHLTTASLYLPPSRYVRQEEQRDFLSRLFASIREAPGIEAIGAASTLPLLEAPNPTLQFRLENQPEPRPGEAPAAIVRVATPGYFETMRIPLLGGRYFNGHDVAGRPPILVINHALARRYWGAQNPVGTRVRMTFSKEPFEVVGMVSNTPLEHLQEEPQGVLYFCFDQFANPLMSIAIRSSRDPSDVAAIVRGAVRELDKELPIRRVSTMEAMISDSVWLSRFLAVLLGGLAVVALTLAAVGVYGLVHYSTTRRIHEIGIRMALGARRRDVLNMLVGHGIKLAVTGITLGIAAAAMLTRTLGTALYNVSPTDPATFVLVAALLVCVAAIASFHPARRASKSEPLTVLRME